MATPAHDKYYLRTLHEEIDLFDRKLAHSENFGVFGSDAEKAAAADKMRAKRDLLARTARQLAKDGVEFKPSELPRSFRSDEMPQEAVTGPAAQETVAAKEPRITMQATKRRAVSHFEGTLLDGQAQLLEYKRSRLKVVPPQA